MPSGITHMLLVNKLQDELPDGDLKNILAFALDFLTVGAVAPDLPYASMVDNDFFLTTEGPLADKFHYQQTNQISLRSLLKIKSLRDTRDEEFQYRIFAFFLGYLSHVVADGIIHPFIRDKVGNYQNNKSAHRSLEMQLDVLYLDEITKKSGLGLEVNYANIAKELLDYTTSQDCTETIQVFTQLIKDVYNEDYSADKINGWVIGLYRLFSLAAGDDLKLYRNLEVNTFLFKDRSQINPEKALILTKPVDNLPENFLHIVKIDYFKDCIPRFFNIYIPIAQKAYNYVFKLGLALTETDIPAINLDTGRLIDNDNLNLLPEFWK